MMKTTKNAQYYTLDDAKKNSSMEEFIMVSDKEKKDGKIGRYFYLLDDINKYLNNKKTLKHSYEIIQELPARFLIDLESAEESPKNIKDFKKE